MAFAVKRIPHSTSKLEIFDLVEVYSNKVFLIPYCFLILQSYWRGIPSTAQTVPISGELLYH